MYSYVSLPEGKKNMGDKLTTRWSFHPVKKGTCLGFHQLDHGSCMDNNVVNCHSDSNLGRLKSSMSGR